MKTKEQLYKEHPYWIADNIVFILYQKEIESQLRVENLLKDLCKDCGREIGCHLFNRQKKVYECY